MTTSLQNLLDQAARAHRENRFRDARRDFTEAIALGRGGGSRTDLITALKGLAQIERHLENGEAARVRYEEAVVLCREEGVEMLLAHTIRHLGDVHREAGQRDLAEPAYREALEIYRRHPETKPLDLANTLRPLALLKESREENDEAVLFWREARDLYTAAGVRKGAAECSAHLKRLGG